jgi:hypothetical protein
LSFATRMLTGLLPLRECRDPSNSVVARAAFIMISGERRFVGKCC